MTVQNNVSNVQRHNLKPNLTLYNMYIKLGIKKHDAYMHMNSTFPSDECEIYYIFKVQPKTNDQKVAHGL